MATPFDTDRLGAPAADMRSVHRRFPTGVTVVATMVDGAPYGLAVNAFASVSIDPPLVLACVSRTAETHSRLFESDTVGISILSAGQIEVARRFASSGGDKFSGLAWVTGQHGVPLVTDAAAHLETRVVKRILAFTHTVFVLHALSAAAFERDPLLYADGVLFGEGLPTTKASD